MLYIIKGKNGAGKTYLANKLYDLGYKRSISYTTRKPRDNEINGYDYNFISKEEFEKLIREGFFAEYQMAGDKYYGTPVANLTDKSILISSDENSIKKYYKGTIILLYIDAPLEVRYRRIQDRNITESEIFDRFTSENSSFLYNFSGCFIDNGNEDKFSLEKIIDCMNNPKYMRNEIFLMQQIKKFQSVDSKDELLTFLQFEEFLLRGIYLDKRVSGKDIEKIYSKYMKKFLNDKKIIFQSRTDGTNYIVLNGNEYCYRLNKDKIEKSKEKKDYEKEID